MRIGFIKNAFNFLACSVKAYVRRGGNFLFKIKCIKQRSELKSKVNEGHQKLY